MTVVLIGTLDTKGDELDFVRQLLNEAGLASVVIDAGSRGTPRAKADICREEVFAAAETNLLDIQDQGDRGLAVNTAAKGVARLVADLHQRQQLDGVFALGGSAGTTIGTAAMRVLPLGIPKVMVSTLASGQVRPYVGPRDIMMVHSVTDISGLNRISRLVLGNAARAMIGMVTRTSPTPAGLDNPLITATMFGVTTPCVEQCRALCEVAGYETLVFHAVGTGGEAMEALIADGLIAGVLDVTTTELADELVGGTLSAGPARLTAAAQRGVPQVVSLGALDMVNFGPRHSVPEKFQSRHFYIHNDNVTLMRTTPEENALLGVQIAEKLNATHGPTALFVPLRGVSAIDAEGQPFWYPEADAALFNALRASVKAPVELLEFDLHINDPAFARAMTEKLLQLIPLQH